jgi:hypothetical protein
MTQSLAQTKTLIPTVNCGEDRPDVVLPSYPVGPAVSPPATLDAANAVIAKLQQYGQQQQEWAVSAAGAFKAERVLRAGTRDCLSNLRASGIIN